MLFTIRFKRRMVELTLLLGKFGPVNILQAPEVKWAIASRSEPQPWHSLATYSFTVIIHYLKPLNMIMSAVISSLFSIWYHNLMKLVRNWCLQPRIFNQDISVLMIVTVNATKRRSSRHPFLKRSSSKIEHHHREPWKVLILLLRFASILRIMHSTGTTPVTTKSTTFKRQSSGVARWPH